MNKRNRNQFRENKLMGVGWEDGTTGERDEVELASYKNIHGDVKCWE